MNSKQDTFVIKNSLNNTQSNRKTPQMFSMSSTLAQGAQDSKNDNQADPSCLEEYVTQTNDNNMMPEENQQRQS